MIYIDDSSLSDCTGAAAAGMKWLGREGYGFADRYGRKQLPLDELKIAYDQKLHYTTLQFRITPELGRKLPGLPVPYDECWGIYNNLADSRTENRCIYSGRVDEDTSAHHTWIIVEPSPN